MGEVHGGRAGSHKALSLKQRGGVHASLGTDGYRGTSLIRHCPPLGPCSRTMPRALWGSEGGEQFLVSEVPL